MEPCLNTSIKEVIARFPETGKILEQYEIGCVSCGVGTCLLKDIIAIHGLPEGRAQELMNRIARAVDPGLREDVPKPRPGATPGPREIRYSPPMKRLVEEHVLIKRWIALIPRVIEDLDVNSEEDLRVIREGIDFIRSYADRFHHAKEEDILFRYFDENSDLLKAMLEEHRLGREHVKALIEAVDRKDKVKIIEHLLAYRDLLIQHITREDEILYPWMDRNLSLGQVEELLSKFHEVDEVGGNGTTARGERFVGGVEERLRRSGKDAVAVHPDLRARSSG